MWGSMGRAIHPQPGQLVRPVPWHWHYRPRRNGLVGWLARPGMSQTTCDRRICTLAFSRTGGPPATLGNAATTLAKTGAADSQKGSPAACALVGVLARCSFFVPTLQNGLRGMREREGRLMSRDVLPKEPSCMPSGVGCWAAASALPWSCRSGRHPRQLFYVGFVRTGESGIGSICDIWQNRACCAILRHLGNKILHTAL
jgi:hypothetical protein